MDDQSSIPILDVGHVSLTAVFKVVLCKNRVLYQRHFLKDVCRC